MMERKDLDQIEQALKYCGSADTREIAEALKLARAWMESPEDIRKTPQRELEVSLKVYEAWNSTQPLKGCSVRNLEEALALYTKWRNSPLLSAKSGEEIRQAITVSEGVNATDGLRNVSAEAMAESFKLRQAWDDSSWLKGKTVQDLEQAIALCDAWNRSPALKYRSAVQLEDAFKKIREWEKSPAGKKGEAGNLKGDLEAVREWDRSALLKKITPRELEKMQKLVEAKRGSSLINAKSLQQLDTAFRIVAAYTKNPNLARHTAQAAGQMLAVAGEWKRVFGNVKAEEFTLAVNKVEAWKKHPVLKDRTIANLMKELKIVEEWHRVREFRGKLPEEVTRALTRLTRLIAKSKEWINTPKASLLFDGEMLYWRQSGNDRSWRAYSGREEFWKGRRFSVEDQKMRSEGPLPGGFYMARQGRYQSLPLLRPQQIAAGILGKGEWPWLIAAWGWHRVWLEPDSGTETYGRDNFSIHGGWEPGSAGCIDLVDSMGEFAKIFLLYGRDVQLEVRYKTVHPMDKDMWKLPSNPSRHDY